MANHIHILGASGSGTTTLGRALTEHLNYTHFDTDTYLWLPTDPPSIEKRERTERQQLLMNDLMHMNRGCYPVPFVAVEMWQFRCLIWLSIFGFPLRYG